MSEVQKLSDLRDEMISRISHEFRTPLTAIRAVSACVPEFGMPPEMAAAMDSSVSPTPTHNCWPDGEYVKSRSDGCRLPEPTSTSPMDRGAARSAK